MPVRCVGYQSLTAQTSPVLSNQVGAGAALVDKDQMARLPAETLDNPGGATQLNIGPLLLGSVDHFFLKVI